MADPDKAARDAERVRRMAFSDVYPLYVAKAERKGRTKAEVDGLIGWLTGYDAEGLARRASDGVDFETFFREAPRMNPAAPKITGTVCGVRVEEVEDPVMRDVRRLDKLVDELAKGRPMEKILRS